MKQKLLSQNLAEPLKGRPRIGNRLVCKGREGAAVPSLEPLGMRKFQGNTRNE